MTRSEIRPGFTIKLFNGSTFTIYMVGDVKYICTPKAHHMHLRLSDICNEDLSPIKGISPICNIWDNYGKLVYDRKEIVTISMKQVAEMLNIPVSQLRIKD